MKKIKINVVDFGGDKRNFLTDILEENYELEYSDKPDFLIYSVFGNEHKKFNNCVKIFYTGEPVTPNFEECDYGIGFDYIEFEDRYLRLPLCEMKMTKDILNRSIFKRDQLKNRKFCNFIYSNGTAGNGALLRKKFCEMLMQYKHNDCPGLVMNNMKPVDFISRYDSNWEKGKINFIGNYKFTIAFENTVMNGYTTEKLIQPLIAGSIPIYYGNPRVVEQFNKEAFINCNDYDNCLDKVIERVIEIDNNDDLAYKMITSYPLTESYSFDWREKLENFLINIIEKGNKSFNIGKSFDNHSQELSEYSTDVLNGKLIAEAIIKKIRQYSCVYIYGDGKYGTKTADILMENNIEIKAYLVSKSKNKTINNIPVIQFDEKDISKDAVILIAVREEAQNDLADMLKQKGYYNLIAIDGYIISIIKACL